MGSRYLETLGNKLWKHSAYLLSPRVLASDAKKARAAVNRIWLPTDRTPHSPRFLPRTHLQLPIAPATALIRLCPSTMTM
jgi:hypothetical protein